MFGGSFNLVCIPTKLHEESLCFRCLFEHEGDGFVTEGIGKHYFGYSNDGNDRHQRLFWLGTPVC